MTAVFIIDNSFPIRIASFSCYCLMCRRNKCIAETSKKVFLSAFLFNFGCVSSLTLLRLLYRKPLTRLVFPLFHPQRIKSPTSLFGKVKTCTSKRRPVALTCYITPRQDSLTLSNAQVCTAEANTTSQLRRHTFTLGLTRIKRTILCRSKLSKYPFAQRHPKSFHQRRLLNDVEAKEMHLCCQWKRKLDFIAIPYESSLLCYNCQRQGLIRYYKGRCGHIVCFNCKSYHFCEAHRASLKS